MKRISILCVLSLTLSPIAFSQELAKPPVNPPGAKAAEKPPVKIAGLGQEPSQWELTLSERTRLGLTAVNALGAAVWLAQADAVDSETHRSITSARILDRIAANNGAIDELDPASLDKALEWIESIYRFVFKALKKLETQ